MKIQQRLSIYISLSLSLFDKPSMLWKLERESMRVKYLLVTQLIL